MKSILQYPIDDLFHALAAPGRWTIVDRFGQRPSNAQRTSGAYEYDLVRRDQHPRILEASDLVNSHKLMTGEQLNLLGRVLQKDQDSTYPTRIQHA